MCRYITVIFLMILLVFSPALAQNLAQTVSPPRSGGAPVYGYNNGYNPGNNGYNSGVRYGGTPVYGNPYNTIYGGYGNPYAPTYEGRYNYGGASVPVYGPPQLINGNLYGINSGGAPSQFWRAPSGFYYPWVGGYNYRNYPIYVVPPNNTAPSQTVPPVSTVISDLDNYLDKAKEKGKINASDYQSLRLRASDLLGKEKALTYEEGGVIDSDSESEIRRDVEGLSAEVAHRVKP